MMFYRCISDGAHPDVCKILVFWESIFLIVFYIVMDVWALEPIARFITLNLEALDMYVLSSYVTDGFIALDAFNDTEFLDSMENAVFLWLFSSPFIWVARGVQRAVKESLASRLGDDSWRRLDDDF